MTFTPVFDDGNAQLYAANNIEFMASLGDGAVDLTVTSPPYDALRDYTSDTDWTWGKFEAVARGLYRITKPGGVVVWNVSDQTKNGSESGSSFRQALFMIDCGFNLADTMIYKKANPGGARGSNKTYIQCFEYMFVFTKGPLLTYNLIKDRANKRPGKQKGGGKRNKDSSIGSTVSYESDEFGRRFNIWEYATQGDEYSSQHPAPFPYKLAEDHIISWSNENDVIFDPFSGSGTTALAAINNKRRAIGVDISPEYTKLASARLADAVRELESLALFGF